jgi:hypothetical protein
VAELSATGLLLASTLVEADGVRSSGRERRARQGGVLHDSIRQYLIFVREAFEAEASHSSRVLFDI